MNVSLGQAQIYLIGHAGQLFLQRKLKNRGNGKRKHFIILKHRLQSCPKKLAKLKVEKIESAKNRS